jgi:hypothetical protein
MRINYKFHSIAIAVICTLITVLYFLFSPKPAPAPVDPTLQGDRAVEIYSATWGQECNPYIQDAIQHQNTVPVEKDANGVLIKRDPLKMVITDNVLQQVGDICNGKTACDITPTSETMGVGPLPSCAKKLVLSYRCYSYDRLWNLTIGQGSTTTIDCNETAKPAGK